MDTIAIIMGIVFLIGVVYEIYIYIQLYNENHCRNLIIKLIVMQIFLSLIMTMWGSSWKKF